MSPDNLVRGLIRDSIRRAVQETIAAVMVLIAFASFLQHSEIGSPRYYGCLIILVATGFVVGVLWSFALSYRLLATHPASDTSFWSEAFYAQARLLRFVPLWYLAPLCSGVIVFAAPTEGWQLVPFLIVAAICSLVFAVGTWLNRRGALNIEERAAMLMAQQHG